MIVFILSIFLSINQKIIHIKMRDIFSIFLVNQMLLIFASIPNWNLDNFALELYPKTSTSSSYEYPLYDKNGYVLKKKITKNNDGTLTARNELTYRSTTKVVEFNDIESTY
jgi:hypothetical protein